MKIMKGYGEFLQKHDLQFSEKTKDDWLIDDKNKVYLSLLFGEEEKGNKHSYDEITINESQVIIGNNDKGNFDEIKDNFNKNKSETLAFQKLFD